MEKLHDPLSLEERLAPKLNQAEYLLPLVVALMLWTAGFVDVLAQPSPDGIVFGLYSIPAFIFLVVYGLGFIFWLVLIIPRNSLTWVKQGIAYIQQRAWLGLTIFSIFGLIIGTILVYDQWLNYSLLAISLMLLMILIMAIILLARPKPQVKMQLWRKITLSLFIMIISLEVILQLSAFLKVLPIPNTSGLFVPYGRVYQAQEGSANGVTNRYGFYYPEFRLEPDTHKIVLTGDTFVQALQVKPEQNMGAVLDRLIAENNLAVKSEVLAVGLPGYGPGIYADTILYPFLTGPLNPNEVVVLFHLANDFQVADRPGGEIPYFTADANGDVEVHPDDIPTRHTLWHVTITGYAPVNPIKVILSQLFTLKFVDDTWQSIRNQGIAVPNYPANIDTVSDEQPLGSAGFAFKQENSPAAVEAMAVAKGLLKNFHAQLAEDGVQMRLVTIPYFPALFYQQYQDSDWSPRVDGYDLFLPERELQHFAAEHNISMLPMGQYLQQQNLTVAEIKNLFYKDGTGHLTPEGHRIFAQAMYACFYSPDNTVCVK